MADRAEVLRNARNALERIRKAWQKRRLADMPNPPANPSKGYFGKKFVKPDLTDIQKQHPELAYKIIHKNPPHR